MERRSVVCGAAPSSAGPGATPVSRFFGLVDETLSQVPINRAVSRLAWDVRTDPLPHHVGLNTTRRPCPDGRCGAWRGGPLTMVSGGSPLTPPPCCCRRGILLARGPRPPALFSRVRSVSRGATPLGVVFFWGVVDASARVPTKRPLDERGPSPVIAGCARPRLPLPVLSPVVCPSQGTAMG